MKVLVTGSKGFVGSNLCLSLKNIRDGKDRRERYKSLLPLTVYEYDRGCTVDQLDAWCADADYVFNLAGVNRPDDASEFMTGNCEFVSTLLGLLEKHENTCPIVLSSSIQASLEGRFSDSDYGKSKLAGEKALLDYSARTGAKVLIYRLPNIYGKWCRPNYNSAVATFCNNIANGLPIQVSDDSIKLELLYIDDLIHELLEALLENERQGDDGYCHASPTDAITLGEIVELLYSFKAARDSFDVPDVTATSFSKKLYSTYVSYLNPEDLDYSLQSQVDDRGFFAEFLRSNERGQISINVTKPGYVKGQHWHHTKWEKFLVVAGEALIRLRRVGLRQDGSDYPTFEYRVSGEDLVVVDIPPGYTHSLKNVSDTKDMVAVIWSNEKFDEKNPDTYFEEV